MLRGAIVLSLVLAAVAAAGCGAAARTKTVPIADKPGTYRQIAVLPVINGTGRGLDTQQYVEWTDSIRQELGLPPQRNYRTVPDVFRQAIAGYFQREGFTVVPQSRIDAAREAFEAASEGDEKRLSHTAWREWLVNHEGVDVIAQAVIESWTVDREVPASDELGIGRDRARLRATLFFEDARGARLIWEDHVAEQALPDPPSGAVTTILHEQQMLVLFDTFLDAELRPLVAALGAPVADGTAAAARGEKRP